MFHNIRFKKHLTTFQSIFLGFFLIIIIGSLLLMLPISSVSGKVTPFNESLFTATSGFAYGIAGSEAYLYKYPPMSGIRYRRLQ